jgi:polyhydroxyalkanoate synthesis regulator phasin
MQDFINSFKAHLYERTASPLLGSFVFYWIVCNYKLIVILFDGDMKVNDKFDLIKTIYPQNIWIPWEGFEIHYSTLLGNGFLLPLIISLIYIIISPFPSKWIYKYWKEKQKEIQEIKQKIDDETPLTKEQSKKIRQDIINLELEYEKIFVRKEEEINQLKTMLNNTNTEETKEVKKLKEEIETLKKTKKIILFGMVQKE